MTIVFRQAAAGAVLAALAFLVGCASPTAPDARRGYIAVRMSCETEDMAPLRCRANTYCTGLYTCPDPSAEGRDVTSTAVWSVDDGRVARVTGQGVFEGVARGDTVIRVNVPGLNAGDASQPASVFDGTTLLPTFEIFGAVSEAGKNIASGPINGAVVEVLDGLVAGRSATSGIQPALLPGYLGPFGGPGGYRILGIPPGSYTVSISASGFIRQRRTVSVSGAGSPLVNVELSPVAN